LETKNLKEATPEERQKVELAAKVEVYQRVCKERVDPALLLNSIRSSLCDAESLFNFRRNFSGQLAAHSLLQYAFCVVERTPARLVFNEYTGQVISPEFRFAYNNQGEFQHCCIYNFVHFS
jgi:phosphatidylinositol kinase/protein kinase (PI-3  family)